MLVAYFSLTGNRDYTSDVDVTSSASLTRQSGEVLGNAEVYCQNHRKRQAAVFSLLR